MTHSPKSLIDVNHRHHKGLIAIYLGVIVLTVFVHTLYIANRGIGQSPAFALDDSLITFRYSLNLAQGHGFVYNAEEHVIGTTTPLFALLGSLPARLGIDLSWFAAVLNTIVDSLVAVLLVYIFRLHSIARLAAPLFFVLHPFILYYSAAGMEMSLLTLLGLTTCTLYWAKHYSLAGVAAALVVLCRIDGVLMVGALMIVALYRERRLPLSFLLAGAIAITPWLLFSFTYFGTIIPQSATAKQIWRTSAPLLEVWMIPDANLFVILALLGVLFGIRNPFQSASAMLQHWVLTIAVWWGGFSLFFMITHVEIEDWYRVPQCAMIAILAAWGLELLVRYLRKLISQRRRLLIPVTIAVIVIVSVSSYWDILTVAGGLVQLFQPTSHQSVFDIYRQTGIWLRDHVKPTDTVLAGNIGFIGYYCGCRILDDVGLVSPQIFPYIIQNNLNRAILITTFHPDFLAIEQREYLEMEQTIRAEGYILTAEFYSVDSYPMSPYRIFARPDRGGLP